MPIGWHASGAGGAIAAGGADAVAAGMKMLGDGGNAIDAAVATIFALSVTDHGAFAIGGEVPIMVFDAKRQQVDVLCGLGAAPLAREAIDWYLANGIPADGDMKAAPPPAVLHACLTALMRYGTKSFGETIESTLALLDAGGRDWYERLARTLRWMLPAERCTENREDALTAVRDYFYSGDAAEKLEAWYIAKGGFLRWHDLTGHETRIERPVTIDYRGYTICKCDTWTQGPVLCQAMRLLEGFDLKAMGHLSADYVHVAAEALKLAFADRDRYYGDPHFADVPLAALLSREYADIRRPLIDLAAASKEVRPGDPIAMAPLAAGGGESEAWPGGTTTCVVADRWGNVVSATPSCNVFGDKGDGGETGITHGNRLRSLNTTPGHPNCIAPLKRPRITLTPTMVLRDGKSILAVSVAGGELQDQTSLNLLLNAIEFDMAPAEAVTAPRFATGHHEDSFNPVPARTDALGKLGSLQLHDGIDPKVREDLAGRGHEVSVTNGPIASPVMLRIDPNTGAFEAAGDPAAGRHAAAID
ncbi:MAG: gamma-glutamyltransferase family protein [Planctomycetota bacterium]|jgi:gamma-glutamyltranspeptidase/glutathione hydrolase